MLCVMISVVSSIRLSERQIEKLADVCGDAAQVFLASVVLPGLGLGGDVDLIKMLLGSIMMGIFALLSLYLLRSPTIS